MALVAHGAIVLPAHAAGGFDHGDVVRATGMVFVAHPANGTVEVLDGPAGRHLATVPGCPEASGVLCAEDAGLVFAAARGGGRVLVLRAVDGTVVREAAVGPRPNGLAWDAGRARLLVADVEDLRARLLDPASGVAVANRPLPGRPRWCVVDTAGDRFLVNVRDPACVTLLDARDLAEVGRWPVSSPGPHGLDLDPATGRAFVACDGGLLVALDLRTGREVGSVPLAGEPDAVWFHPAARRLYVAIGRPGLVQVIDTDALALTQEVATEEGAHTTAFDPVRSLLYVFLPQSGQAAMYRQG